MTGTYFLAVLLFAFAVDAGAVLYDIGRQPRAPHDFFVKFQDDHAAFAANRVASLITLTCMPNVYVDVGAVLLARIRDQLRLL